MLTINAFLVKEETSKAIGCKYAGGNVVRRVVQQVGVKKLFRFFSAPFQTIFRDWPQDEHTYGGYLVGTVQAHNIRE